MALLEKEGLSPKFHLFDLGNKQTVCALRDFMLQRYQTFKMFGVEQNLRKYIEFDLH